MCVCVCRGMLFMKDLEDHCKKFGWRNMKSQGCEQRSETIKFMFHRMTLSVVLKKDN